MLKENISRLLQRLKNFFNPGDARLQTGNQSGRRSSRQQRNAFSYAPSKTEKIAITALGMVLLVVLLYSATQLISYGLNDYRSRQVTAELRQIYQEAEAALTPSAVPTTAPMVTGTPAPVASPRMAVSARPAATAAPTIAVPERLESVRYPGNPSAAISKRFEQLRWQNRDIIGWLTIADVVDEPVVKRNNVYYLDRDYLGYHNVNGAIFLDEFCDMNTRPYTLMLYGHNMKTGAMFGKLRNYENLSYYKNNPFITFDTAYENGRYVIFAASVVGVETGHSRYVNLTALSTNVTALRQAELDKLLQYSVYNTGVDVRVDDQLLLLITCVDNDDERRIVVARRIRDDETEDSLNSVVRRTTRK